MIVTRRHLRIAFLAFLGWFLAEALLFVLLGRAIGFLPAILLLAGKGLLGFMLFARNMRAILGKVALGDFRNGLAAVSDAGFAAAGAFLICLPGLLTTLAGLALFSPSIRAGVVRWARREKKGGGDRILSLDAEEWREIGADPREKRIRDRP